MKNWTDLEEQGHPVITATLNEDGKLVFRQNRFMSTCPPNEEQDKVIWNIPSVALTSNGENQIALTTRGNLYILSFSAKM